MNEKIKQYLDQELKDYRRQSGELANSIEAAKKVFNDNPVYGFTTGAVERTLTLTIFKNKLDDLIYIIELYIRHEDLEGLVKQLNVYTHQFITKILSDNFFNVHGSTSPFSSAYDTLEKNGTARITKYYQDILIHIDK